MERLRPVMPWATRAADDKPKGGSARRAKTHLVKWSLEQQRAGD
jgi:hypothetical protein